MYELKLMTFNKKVDDYTDDINFFIENYINNKNTCKIVIFFNQLFFNENTNIHYAHNILSYSSITYSFQNYVNNKFPIINKYYYYDGLSCSRKSWLKIPKVISAKRLEKLNHLNK